LQNIPKPDEGIDAVQFAGAHQRVEHGAEFDCYLADSVRNPLRNG